MHTPYEHKSEIPQRGMDERSCSACRERRGALYAEGPTTAPRQDEPKENDHAAH